MRLRTLLAGGITAAMATAFTLAPPAVAAPTGGWTIVGHETMNPVTQGQGLATVRRPDGTTYLFFDGTFGLPAAKTAAGWSHVGDPDSSEGYIFQPYQAADPATAAKLFAVTAPDGTETDFVHHDFVGEEYNNSFDAVSPDGQWMVSGEWDHMTRLLVTPTPVLNPAATDPSADLPVTSQIQLDATVTDVQGCTFTSATDLVCSSDDPIAENGLSRKTLLDVRLPHALDGTTVAGHVTEIGPIPLQSTCPVTAPGSWPDDFEVEGVDFDRWTGDLRVELLQPGSCILPGDLFVYRADAVVPPATDPTTEPVTSSTAGGSSTTPPVAAATTVAGTAAAPVAAVPTFTG